MALQNMFQLSFPSNQLILIDFVKDTNDKGESYFYFFSFIPGIEVNGARTYDMKNKVIIKYTSNEMFTLINAARRLLTNTADFPAHTKSARNNKTNEMKSVIISKEVKSKDFRLKEGQKSFQVMHLNLVVIAAGTRKFSMSLQSQEADAMVDQLEEFNKFCNMYKMTHAKTTKLIVPNEDAGGNAKVDTPADFEPVAFSVEQSNDDVPSF